MRYHHRLTRTLRAVIVVTTAGVALGTLPVILLS